MSKQPPPGKLHSRKYKKIVDTLNEIKQRYVKNGENPIEQTFSLEEFNKKTNSTRLESSSRLVFVQGVKRCGRAEYRFTDEPIKVLI